MNNPCEKRANWHYYRDTLYIKIIKMLTPIRLKISSDNASTFEFSVLMAVIHAFKVVAFPMHNALTLCGMYPMNTPGLGEKKIPERKISEMDTKETGSHLTPPVSWQKVGDVKPTLWARIITIQSHAKIAGHVTL
jgi:hypothetical protein